MTMRARRPRRRREARGEERTEAFVEQAAAEETAQLHCLIPESLHRRYRVAAAERRTTMTELVIAAMRAYADAELE